MKWKKILTGTLAAAMLFSNASVANLTALAKETAVVSLESARETLGTLMNEAIEKVNIEKDGIKCPVFAVAVQAAGFDNASAAINDAFGANYNPWK